MTYKLIIDLALLVIVLAFTAVFRKYMVHIYTVGREDAVKCLGLGCAVGFAMGLAVVIGGAVLPPGKIWWLMGLVLLPMALVGFSAGFMLIAGLAGFDGGRQWVLSILIVGGAAVFAANFIPIGGGFIFSGVSAYGLGAAILALWTPMSYEPPAAGTGGAAEQDFQEPVTRTRLAGDLSPLSRPGSENRDE